MHKSGVSSALMARLARTDTADLTPLRVSHCPTCRTLSCPPYHNILLGANTVAIWTALLRWGPARFAACKRGALAGRDGGAQRPSGDYTVRAAAGAVPAAVRAFACCSHASAFGQSAAAAAAAGGCVCACTHQHHVIFFFAGAVSAHVKPQPRRRAMRPDVGHRWQGAAE